MSNKYGKKYKKIKEEGTKSQFSSIAICSLRNDR